MSLFDIFIKDVVKKLFMCVWDREYGNFCFIYIVSLYYNYEIFKILIYDGVKINLKCSIWEILIFFLIVVGNDI